MKKEGIEGMVGASHASPSPSHSLFFFFFFLNHKIHMHIFLYFFFEKNIRLTIFESMWRAT